MTGSFPRGTRVRLTGTEHLGTVKRPDDEWPVVRWDGNGNVAATHVNDIVPLGQPDPSPAWLWSR
jgi:hypothetical protein